MKKTREVTDEGDLDLAARAAWHSRIGGYTQSDIARRLGVSRAREHRLIALARDSGLVKVFVEGEPASARAVDLREFGT